MRLQCSSELMLRRSAGAFFWSLEAMTPGWDRCALFHGEQHTLGLQPLAPGDRYWRMPRRVMLDAFWLRNLYSSLLSHGVVEVHTPDSYIHTYMTRVPMPGA
jgi:hypothetical protein